MAIPFPRGLVFTMTWSAYSIADDPQSNVQTAPACRRERDRVEIGVPDVPPPRIVPERGRAGWMKADRHVEVFELVPQRFTDLVVQMLAVDGVGRADHGNGPQFADVREGLAGTMRFRPYGFARLAEAQARKGWPKAFGTANLSALDLMLPSFVIG